MLEDLDENRLVRDQNQKRYAIKAWQLNLIKAEILFLRRILIYMILLHGDRIVMLKIFQG